MASLSTFITPLRASFWLNRSAATASTQSDWIRSGTVSHVSPRFVDR